MKIPSVKKPCLSCPFRKDINPNWLGEQRIKEILEADSFVCHKTVNTNTERLQCAGHMIIKKDNNLFVRLANSFRVDLKLTGQELIFDKESECIDHHKY